MSGSAAANTAEQIECALAHGFGAVRLNTDRLVDLAAANDERDRAIRASLALLKDGLSPCCLPHSARMIL